MRSIGFLMSLPTSKMKPIRVFLDTAPVIYYIEHRRPYGMSLLHFFLYVDMGYINAVTSPITLAECLVIPYRENRPELVAAFTQQIIKGPHTDFVPIDHVIASKAADLRARYKFLKLGDAIQVATCISHACKIFLTNDKELKKVQEIEVLTVDEIC